MAGDRYTLNVIPHFSLARSLVIKRFIQLIRGQFSRQLLPQPSYGRSHQPIPPHIPSAEPAYAPNSVIYAVSRAEIVNQLNHTLQQSSSPDRFSRSNRQQNHQQSSRKEAPASHTDTIASLADAAFLYERQRRYGEAERLYKQVLMLRQQQFGTQQICVAESLSELAALYRFQQRYDEALPLLQQSLKIRQQLLTSHHLKIGINLHHLADTYRHLRLYGKAEPLFQQALTILRQQLGSEHSKTQLVYSDLMQMLATAIESGRFDELVAELPPPDLSTLSETYSWARPNWEC